MWYPRIDATRNKNNDKRASWRPASVVLRLGASRRIIQSFCVFLHCDTVNEVVQKSVCRRSRQPQSTAARSIIVGFLANRSALLRQKIIVYGVCIRSVVNGNKLLITSGPHVTRLRQTVRTFVSSFPYASNCRVSASNAPAIILISSLPRRCVCAQFGFCHETDWRGGGHVVTAGGFVKVGQL